MKTYKLTPRQEELLAVLLPRPLIPADAAFLMGTTPQAAGRTMSTLCRLQLAYQDVPNFGVESRYVWVLTPEGERVAALKPDAGLPDALKEKL